MLTDYATRMILQLTYNGRPPGELDVPRYVGYAPQEDLHFATLTVRETLEFADKCFNAVSQKVFTGNQRTQRRTKLTCHQKFSHCLCAQPPASVQDERARELMARRIEDIIEMVGLQRCADHHVGGALTRGISGGEKKRVTLAEFLLVSVLSSCCERR